MAMQPERLKATQPNVHTKPTEKSDPSDINNDNPNLDETQTEKTKHPTEIQMKSVKILIMNASDKKKKAGTEGSPAERRKKAIHDVVEKHMPNIVLFQEFQWAGITGKNWEEYPFQEQFVYKGHSHASMMHDKTCITVEDLPEPGIRRILDELQRTPNNRLKRAFPLDFDPMARMSISVVIAKTNPVLKFICISWHGRSNKITTKGGMKNGEKIEYFEYWLELLRIVKEKYKLPILAAGDYNVVMSSIETYVHTPFKLCEYEASTRREDKLVDYCIVTDDLEFTDITWVNLENDTTANNPNDILDHDPIVGSLTASVTAPDPAADTTALKPHEILDHDPIVSSLTASVTAPDPAADTTALKPHEILDHDPVVGSLTASVAAAAPAAPAADTTASGDDSLTTESRGQ